MELKELKKLKRQEFIDIRTRIPSNIKSLIYLQVENFLSRKDFIQSGKGYIGIYWPLSGEVDLRSLKSIYPSRIALPVCINKSKMIYHIWGKNTLIKDYAGIPSPINEPSLEPNKIDILLVPALAIDNQGFRLGYGGGYFDLLRSDSNWKKIPAFAIIPHACVSTDALPKEDWDIPFNGWITEQGAEETSFILGKQKL